MHNGQRNVLFLITNASLIVFFGVFSTFLGRNGFFRMAAVFEADGAA